jgi:hypothetical protein
MPTVRKVAYTTVQYYDGTNAAEALAFLKAAPAGSDIMGPGQWIIESTDPDGTLRINDPALQGGEGFPFAWPVGWGVTYRASSFGMPMSSADIDALYVDAP